jgi:hypothetical protein
MAFTNYTIVPEDGTVIVDGQAAQGVSMVGIPINVHSIQWYGLQGTGTVDFNLNEETGALPAPETFTDPDQYSAQVLEAQAIIEAAANPVTYYYTVPPVGVPIVVTTVGHPQPPDTTTLVPPTVPAGQTLYWYNSAWVVSSFDPNLSLTAAKTSLIQTVTQDGAAAVNTQVSLYSTVQQIQAPNVDALDCKNYAGETIGDYQTYVDGLVSSSTASINAATSKESLYSFNPADIPFTPADPVFASGVINIGRGQFGGPLDLNESTYVTFNSISLTQSQTELYVPGTGITIVYGALSPGGFNSAGPCFNTGDYLIQIRRVSDSFVIAELEVPLSTDGSNEDISF